MAFFKINKSVKLNIDDFILPYFVTHKIGKEEIKSMPGIYRFSIDELLKDLSELKSIKKILLFGIAEEKTETGENAYYKDGVVQRAIRMIKKEFKNIEVIADVCLCGYTCSGHCGIIKKVKNSYQVIIDNQKTVKQLSRIALSYAEAGADFVAPSAMAAGQVLAIREKLNKAGYSKTKILAYSAKYASSFYGPFRDALGSDPQSGDRSSYQLNYKRFDQALKRVKTDIKEGADIVMVKPALAYLDIIYRVKQNYNITLAAYNVSGEYSLIKKAANKKDQKRLALEMLTSIKRAGADLIISYWAKDLVNWLEDEK